MFGQNLSYLPGKDDEHVEAVPAVAEIGALAEQAHGGYLESHLGGEEGVDGVVEAVEDATAQRRADGVGARLEHAERDAVEQDDGHTDPLEPRTQSARRVKDLIFKQLI